MIRGTTWYSFSLKENLVGPGCVDIDFEMDFETAPDDGVTILAVRTGEMDWGNSTDNVFRDIAMRARNQAEACPKFYERAKEAVGIVTKGDAPWNQREVVAA